MYTFDKEAAKIRIAKNAADYIDYLAGEKTFVLNLGVGIPTLIADYVTNENIFIEAENGILGVGPLAKPGEEDFNLINAGRQLVTEDPGCCYFASVDSFGMMRGGHMHATVLGAFSVDEDANISNWIIPGGLQLGVGGAMDLVTGAQNVIVAMTHCDKYGATKLVKKYKLPVTGFNEVDYIVTEYCLMKRDRDINKFVLLRKSDEITLEELDSIIEFDYDVSPDLQPMVK